MHRASGLKHRCFEVSHGREHLLETTAPRHDAALRVGILRDLRKLPLREKKERKDRRPSSPPHLTPTLTENGRIQDLTARCAYGHSYTTERPSQSGGSRHRSFLSRTVKPSMHFDSKTAVPLYIIQMGKKGTIKTSTTKFIASFHVLILGKAAVFHRQNQ